MTPLTARLAELRALAEAATPLADTGHSQSCRCAECSKVWEHARDLAHHAIACARVLPELLDELARAAGRVDHLSNVRDGNIATMNALDARIATLEAENARLREALKGTATESSLRLEALSFLLDEFGGPHNVDCAFAGLRDDKCDCDGVEMVNAALAKEPR
jgi:hypothetical protein